MRFVHMNLQEENEDGGAHPEDFPLRPYGGVSTIDKDQRNSIYHRQFSAYTAKADSVGPNAGPAKAAAAHSVRP